MSAVHKQFKMADVTDTHKQRVMIQFLTAYEVSPVEIHRHLKSVYREHIADVSAARHWSGTLRVVKRRSETSLRAASLQQQ
jgi:hypothetical protein